jgi:hypothetical protein
MGPVRVVVTRIERDGAMHRRMVDTAQQSNPKNWEHLAARALAIHPPYRPIPGTAVYHLRVDGHIIQVGEYDLDGPLRDLAVVVLAIGSTLLPGPGGRQAWEPNRPPLATRSRRPSPVPDTEASATHRPRQPSRGRTVLAGSKRRSCRTSTQTARHRRAIRARTAHRLTRRYPPFCGVS